mmetsp:Transcript_7276/g.16618  ORF Transcript_7276/g.16618 Transcript_7276/m.16618 type:complete len:281 (-) Transcript_7276:6025-6867(-)
MNVGHREHEHVSRVLDQERRRYDQTRVRGCGLLDFGLQSDEVGRTGQDAPVECKRPTSTTPRLVTLEDKIVTRSNQRWSSDGNKRWRRGGVRGHDERGNHCARRDPVQADVAGCRQRQPGADADLRLITKVDVHDPRVEPAAGRVEPEQRNRGSVEHFCRLDDAGALAAIGCDTKRDADSTVPGGKRCRPDGGRVESAHDGHTEWAARNVGGVESNVDLDGLDGLPPERGTHGGAIARDDGERDRANTDVEGCDLRPHVHSVAEQVDAANAKRQSSLGQH